MLKFGDVILTYVQFVDSFEVKKRPALVLFEEFDNVVVAVITSNTQMKGIPLLKSEGAFKNSVIKTNYIFTVTEKMIIKKFFTISSEKKKLVANEFIKRLAA